jgi:hypothetical protein
MAPAIHNLSLARPFAETSREYFSSDGVWRAWSIAAHALPSGYVGAVVTVVTAEFEVEWANPVWQALGVDPHREAERISASVRRVVANLEAPPASALEITDAALGASALTVLHRPADPQPQYGSWVLALTIVVASWVHRPRNPVEAPEAEEVWQPEADDTFEDAVVVQEVNVLATRVEERAVPVPASPLQPPLASEAALERLQQSFFGTPLRSSSAAAAAGTTL